MKAPFQKNALQKKDTTRYVPFSSQGIRRNYVDFQNTNAAKDPRPVQPTQRYDRTTNAITRPFFEPPPLVPRFIRGIDSISSQVMNVKDVPMFDTPDATDFEWINARAARVVTLQAEFLAAGIPAAQIEALVERELNINKPLGRDQRTIKSPESKERSDVKKERVKVLADLAVILSDTAQLKALSDAQAIAIGKAVSAAGVTKNYADLGLPRIVDIDFYNNKVIKAKINFLFLANVPDPPTAEYNYINCVPVGPQNQFGIKRLDQIEKLLQPGGTRAGASIAMKFLDLEKPAIIARDTMIRIVAVLPLTYDNPLVAISTKNRTKI
jgi:hypothetical protein